MWGFSKRRETHLCKALKTIRFFQESPDRLLRKPDSLKKKGVPPTRFFIKIHKTITLSEWTATRLLEKPDSLCVLAPTVEGSTCCLDHPVLYIATDIFKKFHSLKYIDVDKMREIKLRGHLKPIVLRLLGEDGGKTGTELAEEIGDELGSKPSYGSIYPLLQELEGEEIVEVEKIGREKRYSLSPRGRKLAEEVEERKREHMDSLLNLLRTFRAIFEDEEIDLLIENLERRRMRERPHFPQLLQIHHLLLTHDLKEKESGIREELGRTLENLIEILED